jgi:hypothetical protein
MHVLVLAQPLHDPVLGGAPTQALHQQASLTQAR